MKKIVTVLLVLLVLLCLSLAPFSPMTVFAQQGTTVIKDYQSSTQATVTAAHALLVDTSDTVYTTSYNVGMTVVSSGSTSTITPTTTLVQTLYLNNQTALAATVTVTDGSGNYVVGPNFSIPANSNLLLPFGPAGVLFPSGIQASSGTASAIKVAVSGRQ